VSALVGALAEVALRHPDAVALVDGARRVTYAELVTAVDRTADALAVAHGVREGDRVASVLPAGCGTIVLLFACAALGAALVPLSTRLAPAELEDLVHAARPKVTFGDTAVAGISGAVPLPSTKAHEGSSGPRRAPVADDTIAVVLFTSGSTGRPKGVCITQRHVVANARATKQAWGLEPGDVTVNAAPMFHAGGLFVLTLPLLLVGGTVVSVPRFDAAEWARLCLVHRATIGFGVPTMLERLVDDPGFAEVALGSRLWISGGAPCPPALFHAFRAKGARLVAGFGMTEVGPNCFRPVDGMDTASVGVPTQGLEATLVADGVSLPPDADGTGELWLRGPQVAAGYFERDDETRAAFVGGAVRTGDVFTRKSGLYYVTGRVKDMYISGGENVYAGEVERVLSLHPDVREAAIVGVPDATWGEVGHAFVVAARPLDEDEVRAFVRAHLAAYKVPKRIFTLDELPRTGSGKIAKGALPRRSSHAEEPPRSC